MNSFLGQIIFHSIISRRNKQILLLSGCLSLSVLAFAQNNNANKTNDLLLDQYIKTQGNNAIIFDFTNIKQFWVDPSCISRNGSFDILLNNRLNNLSESIPLKVQLVNVNEIQDCKIDVFAEMKEFCFSILDNQSRVLSSSQMMDDFLNYSVVSSTFHLEDTINFSFKIKFASKSITTLSIKKIVLSFSKNEKSSFLVSPGKTTINGNAIRTASTISNIIDNSFSITGKRSQIFYTKKILIKDNPVSCSVKVKNSGTNATTVYIGYAVYTKDNIRFDARNYPYQNINKILNVISCSGKNDKIIVDSYTNWAKNCYLALNAKEDMSDIPNTSFVGTIREIKKLNNEQAEITLEKPLTSRLEKGTKVRVHGPGGAYLYTIVQNLQPNEETLFSSTIRKDESFLQYSNKAFSRGVYYVVPLILSYSTEGEKENTVEISDYSISY